MVAVFVVLGGLAWLVRNSIDLLPSQETQDLVERDVKGLDFSERGQIISVSFTGGGALRVNFDSQLNTEDLAARNTLRRGLAAVMNVLIKQLPHRDLTVAGFEGDRQIGQAKFYRVVSSRRSRTANPTSR